MGNGKGNRDLSDEITWGMELADHMGVPYGSDDYWEDEFEDEDEPAPTINEQKRGAMRHKLSHIDYPEGAEDAEKLKLDQLKQLVEDKLQVDPIGDNDISAANTLFANVEEYLRQINVNVGERKDTHDSIRLDYQKHDEAKGEINAHQIKIAAAQLGAKQALDKPITNANNAAARTAVTALEKMIQTCADELEAFGGKDGIEQVFSAFGIGDDDLDKLDTAFGSREKFLAALARFGTAQKLAGFCDAFGEGLAGADALGPIMDALGGPAKAVETADALGGADKLAALRAKGHLDPGQIKTLCNDLGPAFIGELMGSGDDPKTAIDLHAEFGADIDAFTDLVKEAGFDGKPKTLAVLLNEGCKGKADEFKNLCTAFGKPEERASLKGVIDKGGLGDTPEALAAMFADGCGGDPETLKSFAAGFDDDDKRDGLNRMLNAGGLKGETGKVDPGTLGALFKNISGDKPTGTSDADFARTRAAAMANLAKDLDPAYCGKMKTLLEDGGLGTDPEVFGHLAGIGCDKGDPTLVKGLLDGLCADATGMARLDDLLKKGGLGTVDDSDTATGTDPKCLAYLLKPGCEGKPGEFLKLVKGMDDGNRADLKKVMAQGGMGTAPEALARLYETGCAGTPETFTAFVGAFDDDGKRDGLKRMLDAGGLKGETGKVSDKTLGALFMHVSGDKPTGTSDADFAKTRAAQMADLASKLDPTDCANLKTMLEDGGLGTDPEVFGHLIGTGCGKGDAAKVKTLTTKLAADATGLAGIDDLLKKGGFGTVDDGNSATGTDPKCLAHLLEPGCDGNPDEMLKLAKALGHGDRTALKGVMTDGALGTHPEVLGKMYQHGCLTDPAGAHDGPKSPQKLKDMVGEFAYADGPKLFKNMMTTGGFGTPGKEERLGSVLRYGFTDKSSNVANLKELHVMAKAFDTSMPDLDKMLNAMETAPAMALPTGGTEALQPGGGLQNVLAWTGHNGSAANLKTKFFDKLNAPSPAPTGTQGPNQSLDTLIQTAASFEATPIPAARSSFTNATGQQIDMRSDHILGRHSRKYQDFHQVKDHNTLFPTGLDSAAIDTMGQVAVGNIAVTQKARNRSHGFGGVVVPNGNTKKQTPPRDVYDLNGATSSWPADGVASGQGFRVKVGFKPSDVDGSRVMLDQLFPDNPGDPDVIDVNQADMRKVRDSLK